MNGATEEMKRPAGCAEKVFGEALPAAAFVRPSRALEAVNHADLGEGVVGEAAVAAGIA